MHVCLYEGVDHDRFKALGSPARRAILALVRDQERPVAELAAALGTTQPATSQHLAVLREAGLVQVRAEGRRRWYRADHEALRQTARFFDDYWAAAADRLVTAAEDRARRGRGAA